MLILAQVSPAEFSQKFPKIIISLVTSVATVIRILLLGLFFLCGTLKAANQYAVDWFTVDGGGTTFNSVGPYSISGTIGQHDAGLLGGSSVVVAGGFWSFQFIPLPIDTNAVPDLAITVIDSPDPAILGGGNITYTIQVMNHGFLTATGVRITNSLPAGVNFVSANSSQGTCSGTSVVICDFGALAGGASGTMTIVVTPTIAGSLINLASVSLNESDSQPFNNDASQLTTVVTSAPQNFAWVGSSSDWSQAGNWNPSGIPGAGDTVSIPSGTVNIVGDINVARLNLIGGTLTGDGILTVGVEMNWGAGSMTGNGRTLIAQGAVLNITNAGVVSLFTRTLENAGTIIWSGSANLNVDGGSVITNRAGALWEVRNSQRFNYPGSSIRPRFDNAGTFRKTMSTGATTFPSGFPFNNFGGVEVNSGALVMVSGTSSGPFVISMGAMVEFTQQTYFLNNGAQLNGAGLYKISDGLLAVDGEVPVQNLDLRSTLDGVGTLSVNGTMNWLAGRMRGAGRTLISTGAVLNINNTPGVVVDLGFRTLENAGTVVWNGGDIIYDNDAVITNRQGALWEARTDRALIYPGSGNRPRFDNAGIFRKTGSTGTNTLGGNFNNSGAMEIQSGTLLLNTRLFEQNGRANVSPGATLSMAGNGGSATGVFEVAANGLVDWTSGNYSLEPGAQLNGSGLYRNSGGTLDINGNVAVQNFHLLGTLGGTGLLTINTVLNWGAGSMTGTGRTLIAPGAVLNITNAVVVALLTRTLENAGTIIWSGSTNLNVDGGSVITNRAGALWEVRNSQRFNYPGNGDRPRFDNAGTFRKTTTTGTNHFSNQFAFNNFGILDLQSGTLNLVNANYAPNEGSSLNVAIGGLIPGLDFGQLQVGGGVTFNGTLNLSLKNNFVPGSGNSFPIVTYGSHSGSFANVNGRNAGNGLLFQTNYQSGALLLTMTDAPPTGSGPGLMQIIAVRTGGQVDRFQIRLPADVSGTYRIEVSTNLQTWTTLRDMTPSSGQTSFEDPLNPGIARKFYRPVKLP